MTVNMQNTRRKTGSPPPDRAAAMSAGLPEVRRTLEALWSDRGAREAWAQALARAGAHRLPPGDWIVEHPPGWPEHERTAMAEDCLRLVGVLPGFVADTGLGAGLRLLSDGATLDATPAALVAGAGALEALLAEIPPPEAPRG